MADRRAVAFGTPLEHAIGFSRAVRVGELIAVAGTAPIDDDGGTACPGDVAGQTRRCLAIVERALAAAGASLSDAVRTRVMLTDIDRWQEAARAHAEIFLEAPVKPVTTFVGVTRFIDPAWLVEVEVDAIAVRGVGRAPTIA